MCNVSFTSFNPSTLHLLKIVQNVVVQCKTFHYFAPRSTRNRFCWPGRVASVLWTEICFAWRNIQWHLKKRLEGVQVTNNYNSLCCILLKLSPLGLKKTIPTKEDFDSVYNWMFWMYSIRGYERVTKSLYDSIEKQLTGRFHTFHSGKGSCQHL